jgi:hypothetical protein
MTKILDGRRRAWSGDGGRREEREGRKRKTHWRDASRMNQVIIHHPMAPIVNQHANQLQPLKQP